MRFRSLKNENHVREGFIIGTFYNFIKLCIHPISFFFFWGGGGGGEGGKGVIVRLKKYFFRFVGSEFHQGEQTRVTGMCLVQQCLSDNYLSIFRIHRVWLCHCGLSFTSLVLLAPTQ